MTFVINYKELSNGVKLPYVEHGKSTGLPVLLLHGVTDSWRSFERVLPHLPKSIHAFALTQRGHADAIARQQGTAHAISQRIWLRL